MIENNFENLDKWIFRFKGKSGTPYEGGVYICFINFPEDYPNRGPKVNFINNFKHMFVYNNG